MGRTCRRLTPAELSLMDELYWAGHIDRELDAATGRPKGTAARWRRQNDYPPNGIRGGRPYKEYVVYAAKTDELLAIGSAEACAKAMGLANRGSFFSIVSRVRSGRNKRYVIVEMEG